MILEKMINKQKLSYKFGRKIPISKNLQIIKKNNYKKSNFISNGDDYQILFTASLTNLESLKTIKEIRY